MKTPVQELIEQILFADELYFDENGNEIKTPIIKWHNKFMDHIDLTEFVNSALKIEKQRMFHCFNAGAGRVCDKEFNEYYNKLYGNEEKGLHKVQD